ncbi:hypothetical protein BaRGS_00015875 [Batillaria attramentaria]|uniref:Uncharacterized protein n=1 Tax=Batillaria attramentaria TaxID=370345 RepID=A0ABD0L0W5_9CAEN
MSPYPLSSSASVPTGLYRLPAVHGVCEEGRRGSLSRIISCESCAWLRQLLFVLSVPIQSDCVYGLQGRFAMSNNCFTSSTQSSRISWSLKEAYSLCQVTTTD